MCKASQTRSVDELSRPWGLAASPRARSAAVSGDRRQGEGVPRSPDRERLALSVDRQHLREGAPEGRSRVGRDNVAVGVDSDGRREIRTHPTSLTITHIFESEFCCSRCDIDEAR